jgi:hypothetical protein
MDYNQLGNFRAHPVTEWQEARIGHHNLLPYAIHGVTDLNIGHVEGPYAEAEMPLSASTSAALSSHLPAGPQIMAGCATCGQVSDEEMSIEEEM